MSIASDKVAVAQGVALKLANTEAAIDEAISKAGLLIADLAQARSDLRLSAVAGQETAEHVSAALTALVTGRREVVAAHAALAGLQTRIGLRDLDLSADMMGPLDKPPPPTGRVVEGDPAAVPTRLRAV